MNPFSLRLQVGACVTLALLAHAFATDTVANDPEGMFVYHISGALMDMLLCLVVTAALSGIRGRIMGWLMAASIGVNIVGYVLYLGYVSPVWYNAAMWTLTAAQAVVLFMPRALCLRLKDKLHALLPWPTAGSAL